MKIEDIKVGDQIQRNGETWLVEYVFPEKIVAKRTIDVMAGELEGFEKVNDYGSTVRKPA